MSSATPHRHPLHATLAIVLAGWAVYTALLSTGHFLSRVPKYRGESAWLILVALTAAVALSAGRFRTASLTSESSKVGVAGFLPVLAGFCLLSFGAYAGALSLGLLSDDYALLARVARHDFFTGSQFFRPVPLLGWAVAPHGPAGAWWLHAVNLLLHGVNATLVAVLARWLGTSKATAVASGVLFACFAASVEAVAWASGIQDLLVTTGCLGFVLACAIDGRPRLALVLSLISLLVALGSKETAVAAPLLAVVMWTHSGRRWHTLPVVCGVVVVIIFAILRLSAFPVEPGFTALPSPYFVKEVLSRLFSALTVPFTGAELLRLPVLGIVMAWLLAGVMVHLAWTSRTDPRLPVTAARCAIWAVIAVLPVWSMFFVSPDLQGSRYLYLPACGWSILLAVVMIERPLGAPRRAGLALVTVLAAVWLVGVRAHMRDWQEAAHLRDRVLSSAVSGLQSTSCAAIAFTNLPDAVGGAYVFRNGFVEATQGQHAGSTRPSLEGGAPPGCTVRWDGERFRPAF
jgi:hypothetical protein